MLSPSSPGCLLVARRRTSPLVKDTRGEFVRHARLGDRRNYTTVLCLLEFPIDQISAGSPPKPQKKTKGKKKTRGLAAIRLKWEQTVRDSFHLNRIGHLVPISGLCSGVDPQRESAQLKLFPCTFNSETTHRLR